MKHPFITVTGKEKTKSQAWSSRGLKRAVENLRAVHRAKRPQETSWWETTESIVPDKLVGHHAESG